MSNNKFQSTLPREERRSSGDYTSQMENFNPRSHERSDEWKNNASNKLTISIHAPTRGATKRRILDFKNCKYFNPRSHERSDGRTETTHRFGCNISIHAPTRGATLLTMRKYSMSAYFNPRSHERSDFFILFFRMVILYFNPRSHERSDQNYRRRVRHCKNFNPRSHERSDLQHKQRHRQQRRFQSTLPREERPTVRR